MACYDAPHRYTWFGLAGVLVLIFLCGWSWQFKTMKTLLVMGLQRETASRGVLAIYTSVCLIHRLF